MQERPGSPGRCCRRGSGAVSAAAVGALHSTDGQSIPAVPGASQARGPAHTPSSSPIARSACEMKNNCKPVRPELPEFITGCKRKEFSPWDFSFLSFVKRTQLCLLKTSCYTWLRVEICPWSPRFKFFFPPADTWAHQALVFSWVKV